MSNSQKNRNNGYTTHRDKVADLLNAAKTDLAADKPKDLTSTAPDIFESQNEQPVEPLFATDLMTTPVVNPVLNPVEKFDSAQQINVKPVNPENVRVEQNAAKATYVEMDRKIKAEFMAEMKNVDPKMAGQLGGMMQERPEGFMLVASLADDVVAPGAGAVAAAMNAMLGDNAGKMNDSIAEALDNLRAKTSQQNELAKQGKAPAPVIDWTKVAEGDTGVTQIKNLLMTPVTEQPFMKQAAENEKIIDQMDKNFAISREVDQGQVAKVTAGHIENAVQSGNDAQLAALVRGNENKVQAAKQGRPVVADTAADARTFTAAAHEITGARPKPQDISDLDEGAKDVLASLGMEPKMNQLVPKLENSFAA